MRRMWFVLLLVALCGVNQHTDAATLEAGWYVDLWHVGGWYLPAGSHDPPPEGMWFPAGQTGQQGPLLVEHPWADEVKVIITEDAQVTPGTVLWEDYGLLTGSSAVPSWDVTWWKWRRDYDATQIRLLVYFRRPDGSEEPCAQIDPGPSSSYDIDPGGLVPLASRPLPSDTQLVFRLQAVPEPGSVVCLATSLLLVSLWRRKQSC